MMTNGVADLVGRVLAGRYRLISVLGTGAGGRVYLGEDVQLKRRVAVKVLHNALAEDAGFLRRFHAEAQASAGMSHPNIVTVYDWGEDGVPFMVLELLEGGSLRALLDAGGRLTPSQAAHIGRQVAAALAYAHDRGLVHRDIKPANLLFDAQGRVRIADFGLARALAEASLTEPSGGLLGTTRYAAPEQATGRPLDGRADLYALALVLVESVAGYVPLVADTPIGTLGARAQNAISAPPEMGALGPVISKAGRPMPSERYGDASAMTAALADAAAHLPPPGPLPLAGMVEALIVADPTVLARDARRHAQDETVAIPKTDRSRRTSRRAPIEEFEEDEEDFENPRGYGHTVPAGRPKKSRRRAKRIARTIKLVVVLAVLGGAAYAVNEAGVAKTAVSVPNLIGRSEADATASAKAASLEVVIGDRRVSTDPSGTVLEQTPSPGDWTRDGKIELIVSRGPPSVRVPGVTGKTEADASKLMGDRGFVVVVTHAFDSEIPAGSVITTEPPLTETDGLPRGSEITLVVSDGPQPIAIPDEVGKNYEDAASDLDEHGFMNLVRVDEFSDTVAAGVVIETRPAPGESVVPSSEVTIVVSKGPDLVEVPKVQGLSLDAASAVLADAGFETTIKGNYPSGSKVATQSPAPGEMVKRGTAVTVSF